MSTFGDWVERLFQVHKFMRRFLLFWATAMITFCGIYLYIRGGMTEPESDAYLGLIGMLATATALYTWSRKNED